jgi:hypothetical protein
MATLALSLAGQVAGGVVGGPIGATIGRALGALAGAAVDGALFGEKPAPEAAGGIDVRLTGSSEGVAIPRLYGWGRLSGNIIWATQLEELTSTTAGSKGFGAPEPEAERTIVASFAVAFSEGEVARLGRIWADGQLLETAGLNLRFYGGSETQQPDSLIEAVQGVDNAPAYRGLCYLVVERLPLGPFGNRIPNISAELCRPVGELEPQIRAINVIPGAGEFVYDPTPRVRIVSPGVTASENAHQSASVSNWTLSIDELQALYPNLQHVQLVIAWFGDDLRCAECAITPRHEGVSRVIDGATWSVDGWTRETAPVVSMHEGGLAYGGTPSDASVLAAIADLKARGLSVTIYPLMMMDIPHGNPMGQPAYPWRGRITCDPPEADTTADVTAQVAAFVPGYRNFILHHADLAVAAGGVDALIIGTEMRGLTFLRDDLDAFPFVDALVELAADVRATVGAATRITYAADWSEFTGLQPGGGARYFHLDPLWASEDIDALGLDNYMPAADWRDGLDHADAETFDGPHDVAYLKSNISGGEGFEWYYASDADRIAGSRSPIEDGANGEHWVWRFKDLAGWWSNPHHNRPGGVRDAAPTAWVPESKPIWFTELGCGAVDKGANQPSAFGDPKSFEDTRPHFSTGAPDALMQRQFLRAHFAHWSDEDANPASGVYDGRMVDVARLAPWAWDARPYPTFPTNLEAWSDGTNHATGHWLTGRAGTAASDELAAAIAPDYGIALGEAPALPPLVHGVVIEGVMSARDALAPMLAAAGLSVRDATDGLALTRASLRGPSAIAADDLAAADGPLASRRRGDPNEEIGRLALGFTDRERSYLTGTVTAMKPDGAAAVVANAGLVLDLAGARIAAERMLTDLSAQRETLEFALPYSAAALEPGDAVTVAGQGEGPFEITAIRDGEVRRITARTIPPAVNAVVAVDRPRAVGSSGAVARAIPLLVAAHLPADPATPAVSRLLLAASATPWPGRVLVTDDVTGAEVARLGRSAALGALTEALGAGPTATWDMGNVLVVQLPGGHLAAADDVAVLGGANRVAVEMDDGTWEVIGFAEAELVAPATYRLTRLLRGLGGTDHAIGPASAGNRVVLLDGRLTAVDVAADWLGDSLVLRAYAGATDPTGVPFTATIGLDPVLPLAPVHLSAARAPGSGDVSLGWMRRSRADSGGWALADVPLEHAPEAYRVTILDGATEIRVIEAAGPAATYTAAQQSADWGSPPDSFAYRVAQLSAASGAGHAAIGEFNA